MAEKKRPTQRKRSSSNQGNWFSKIVAAIGMKAVIKIVSVLVLLIVLSVAGASIVTSLVTSSDTTQLGLKDIGELATQAAYYTNVELLEESKKLWKVTLPFTSSRYIFSYDGIIKAGYDFAQIEVEADKATKTVEVKLPEVRTISNDIDNDSLVVYDESRSLFTPLTVESLNKSIGDIKREAEETAIENGLYEAAEENAKIIIGGFLTGMYPDYEVKFVK